MTIIKLTISFFILLLYSTMPIDAQVSKIITKESAEQTVKTSIKTLIKSTTKKSATKEAFSKIKKEALEEDLKKEAKQSSFKIITKNSSKSILKENTESAGRNTLLKEADMILSKKTTKSISKHNYSYNTTKISKKQTLENILDNQSLDIWRKSAGKNILNDKILLDDINRNPALGHVFTSNPNLLKSYGNMIESKYRTDITQLRYLSYNADKNKLMYFRNPKNREWLKGNDIKYVDIDGKTHIINKLTNKTIGYIEGNAIDGYIIKVNKYSSNPLCDLYPMKNTTYICGNKIYKTDKYGRIIYSKITIDKNVIKAGRDKDYIGRVKNFKGDYNIYGIQAHREGTYDDIAGHIIADSWGGESFFWNIIPQNNEINSKSAWRNSERQGLTMAKKGHLVCRETYLSYPDKTSMRPSFMDVTQTVDGKIQRLKTGELMDKFRFNNKLVRK